MESIITRTREWAIKLELAPIEVGEYAMKWKTVPTEVGESATKID